MTWLLGIGSSLGVGATVALAFLLYYAQNRFVGALHQLISVNKDLAEARRDIDGYRRRGDELSQAVKDKDDEIKREREARDVLETQLGKALELVAKAPDTKSAVAGIRSELDRLKSLVPKMP